MQKINREKPITIIFCYKTSSITCNRADINVRAGAHANTSRATTHRSPSLRKDCKIQSNEKDTLSSSITPPSSRAVLSDSSKVGSESLSGASGFSISRLGSSSKRVGEEPRDDRPFLGEGDVDEEERSDIFSSSLASSKLALDELLLVSSRLSRASHNPKVE